MLQGENPYAVAPGQIDEQYRHPVYWQRINHKEVPAAYPPMTQLALAVGVAIHHSPMGMKLLFGLCDLLVVLVLWFWLKTLGRPPSLSIVHGFCPLMVVEFSGEGHSDSLAILFLLLSFLCVGRGLRHTAGASLALATASKLMPVVFLPFLWRQARWIWLPFLVVLALVYVPFLHENMLAGTARYSGHWSGNASMFGLLEWLFDGFCGYLEQHGLKLWNAVYFPQNWAKVPIALFGIGLLWRAWRRRWPVQDVAFAFFAFFVACTPTLHPWYLAFLVPFLALCPDVWLLVFCGTVYLAYEPLPAFHEPDGKWDESPWVKALEYLPFYVGLWRAWSTWGSGAESPASSRASAATADTDPPQSGPRS